MDLPRDARVLLAAGVGAVGLLVATGVAMAFLYEADPSAAHASVAAMPALLRSAHAWSASIAVAVGLVLAARLFVLRAAPRVGLAAVGGIALLLAAFESGAVLAWDERAWEAWLHVRSGASLVGLQLGSAEDPTSTPLALVLVAHVAAAALLVAILIPVLRRTSSRPAPRALVLALALALVLALALALALPPQHGPAPVPGLAVSRPHWPFLWLTPLQDAFGSPALLALPLALGVAALLAWRPPTIPALRVILVLATALLLSFLTFVGGFA